MRFAGVLLTLAVGGLAAAGLAAQSSLMAYEGVAASRYSRQGLWLLVGLVPLTVLALTDYRRLRPIGWLLLAGTLVLLVLARIPGIGTLRNGAWRWIDLGPVQIQPSELGKLALILTVAAYADTFRRVMGGFRHGLLVPALFVGPLLALVLIGKDLGTTLLLAAVAGAMLYVGGAKLRHLALPVLLGLVGLGFYLANDPTRWGRIEAWLHPEQHAEGQGFQVRNALLALGAGGPFGRGLGEGIQKHGAVPEQHTDFILSAIGEEAGLVGTGLVLLAYVALLAAGALIARRARDTLGLLIAFGATFTIALQAFINIGVVTAVLPNKGIALPFVSYGGSSLVSMLALVGLLFSVARHAAAAPEEEEALPAAADDLPADANPFAP